jgi:hypothetical protein
MAQVLPIVPQIFSVMRCVALIVTQVLFVVAQCAAIAVQRLVVGT